MQNLCNHLCYSYARATRAVSVSPASVSTCFRAPPLLTTFRSSPLRTTRTLLPSSRATWFTWTTPAPRPLPRPLAGPVAKSRLGSLGRTRFVSGAVIAGLTFAEARLDASIASNVSWVSILSKADWNHVLTVQVHVRVPRPYGPGAAQSIRNATAKQSRSLLVEKTAAHPHFSWCTAVETRESR